LSSLNHSPFHLPIYFCMPFRSHSYGTQFHKLPHSFLIFHHVKFFHHFILCALTYLTVSSRLIHFSTSSLFPIPYPSSFWNGLFIILNIFLPNTINLFLRLR
jgi:hypothetical protein